eukprot:scaffold236_cov164-Ochromonas_danica.AAC.10
MNLITKAHNLLSKGDVNEAIYVSNCLEEILKAPSLTKQECDLLSLLYLKMLDRVFGDDTTTSSEVQTTQVISSNAWVKGEVGGWIRALCQQGKAGGGGKTTSTAAGEVSAGGSGGGGGGGAAAVGSIDCLTHPGSKLLKHFLPKQPLLAILTDSDYELHASLLPPKIHMMVMGHSFYPLFAQSSHQFLLQHLLRSPHLLGRELTSEKLVVRLDPLEYFLFCLTRYPTLSHYLTPWAMKGGNQSTSPSYALHNGPQGCMTWVQNTAYLCLLWNYLQAFLLPSPSSPCAAGCAGPTSTTSSSAALTVRNASSPSSLALTLSGEEGGRGMSSTQRIAQLLLFLCIENWINCAYVLHSDYHQVALYRKQLYAHRVGNSNLAATTGEAGGRLHPSPIEAVMLDGTAAGKFSVASLQIHNEWWLWFREEESAIDRELQRLAIHLWLLFLQPWKVSEGPKATYSIAWRSFVVHHLHFYTTLFVAFWKMMARGGDKLTSLTDKESQEHLLTLEEVLTVFTQAPTLLETADMFLDTLIHAQQPTGRRRNSFSQNGSGQLLAIANESREVPITPLRSSSYISSSVPPALPPTTSSPSIAPVEARERQALIDHHERLFPDRSIDSLPQAGILAPRQAGLESAASISLSLQQLLEGVRVDQHAAGKWINQVFSAIESVLLGASQVTGPEKKIVNRAERCLAMLTSWNPDISVYLRNMEQTLSVSVNHHRTSLDSASEIYRDIYTKKLTAEGQRAVLMGCIKCGKTDFTTAIDALDQKRASYEHTLFVHLLSRWSKLINQKWQLPRRPALTTLSWPQCYQLYVKELHGGDQRISTMTWQQQAGLIYKLLQDSFRVNLRPLARYRVIAILVLCIAYWIVGQGDNSTRLVCATVLACYGSYLLYMGSFSSVVLEV